MKNPSLLFQAGANRGGREFFNSYIPSFLQQPSKIFIADPHKDRADNLARLWNKRGIKVEAIAKNCEDVITDFPKGSITMLTIDSINSMVSLIERNCKTTIFWQILGLSAGIKSTVIGFTGIIPNNDDDAKNLSIDFLKNLIPYDPSSNPSSVSSQQIENVLDRRIMSLMRKVVSNYSAQKISLLYQNPSMDFIKETKFNLFFGTKRIPLIIRGATDKNSEEVLREALETEDPLIGDHKDFAIAFLFPQKTEIFIIGKYPNNRRSIRFHTIFGEDPERRKALVTD